MLIDMTGTKFSEKQRFRQIWLWILMVILGIPLYYYSVRLLFFNLTTSEMCQMAIAMLTVLHIITIAFLLVIKLEVEITNRHITYRLSPFHFRKKVVPLNQLHCAYIRLYNPVKELSFMGIHFGKGPKAYCINGFWGLQLEFAAGRQLLIGTQRPEEMNAILKKLGIPEE